MIDIGSLAAEPLFGLPLAELWFALLFFIFGMFLFLDGFDFGVGVLFATRADDHEKEQLLEAIGPFWDGNEVWLVVFGGALFAAFPSAYANLFSRFYLLMFAILAALGLRGLAPEMYEEREADRWRRLWGYSFVVGSTLTPFLLGVFVMNWLLGTTELVTLAGVFGGVTVLALVIVDGAAFLGLKTRGSLRDDVSTYGIRAAVIYLIMTLLTLGAVYVTEPNLRALFRAPGVVALVAIAGALTTGYIVAVRRRRWYVAFGTAAALVFGLVALIATLMFPFVDRATSLTIQDASISVLPLNLMSIMASVLLPIVLTYFVVLYSAFSGPVTGGEAY